jgi:hypothetical protein
MPLQIFKDTIITSNKNSELVFLEMERESKHLNKSKIIQAHDDIVNTLFLLESK